MQSARPFAGSFISALQTRRLRAYLEILAVGSGARVFGLASQFVVLIILGRLLSKQSFGDLMTAFGFYRLVATALGVGGSLVLLFHVSRRPDDLDFEVKLHRYSAIVGALIAAAVALCGVVAAEPIATGLGKPGLASWFRQLAPFAVFSTLLIVSTGALEGRSRVSQSIVMAEVAPNAIRIILLPIVAWAQLEESYVAHVLTISVLFPWLWSAHRLWEPTVSGVRPWSSWDYSYCGKFVAATLFANQLGAIDILVAGMLFPSEAVADYAVASRIAALYGFFQLAILKRFAPRAGSLLEKSDLPALRQEVELCRNLMIGCCALNISGLLLVAPFILPLFGNYAAAQTFLIWLAVPTFVQSFYAASDRLLIMAGQANVLLMLTASSFLVLTTAPFLTASWLGMTSIPSAMIVSALVFNPMVARRARKLFDVRTVRLRDFVVLAGGAGALAAYAALGSMQMRLMACGLLAGIGALSLRAAIRTAGKQGAAIYQLGDDQARTGCRPSMELLPDKQAR